MPILSTPHSHTCFVDGKSTPAEMATAACARGFVSLGFSEHGPQSIDPQYGLKDVSGYIEAVNALKHAYRGRMRVHLGIERDLYSHAERAQYEYVICACHYFLRGEAFTAVDGAFEPLAALRDSEFGGDGAELASSYFRMLGDYALSYRPEIVAHFDLVKKQNRGGRLYDPDDAGLRRAQFEALEKILSVGALIEVNTGGMARGYMDAPYPEPLLLRRFREMGGRVIASSDCHDASLIDFAFDRLPEYLAAAGYETAWRLGAEGEAQFAEYAIRD